MWRQHHRLTHRAAEECTLWGMNHCEALEAAGSKGSAWFRDDKSNGEGTVAGTQGMPV